MRIAMVTDSAGRDSTDLTAALAGLGHEIHVHRSPYGRRGNGLKAWFVEQWQATPPAVVHCQSRSAGIAATSAARAAGIPVVHSVRTPESVPTKLAERDLALRADRVIVSSTADLMELIVDNVPRTRISVVPEGVDTDHFTPDGDRQETDAAHRIVAVGDLNTHTGFATAVAALRGWPDSELVLAGGPRHGNHAKELRAYARHLGVAHRLRIPGPVDRANLPALLRSAHVALCTPWRPTFGIAALEAAACGVAVVANDTGGLPDTVVDGVTGLLVAPHQPRALAAAVWRLLAHPVLCEQFGAAGRDRACVRYSWRQIAVDTLSAYRLAGAVDPRPRKVAAG